VHRLRGLKRVLDLENRRKDREKNRGKEIKKADQQRSGSRRERKEVFFLLVVVGGASMAEAWSTHKGELRWEEKEEAEEEGKE
jgi:hypothetical protein